MGAMCIFIYTNHYTYIYIHAHTHIYIYMKLCGIIVTI